MLPPLGPAEVLSAPWLRSDFANFIRLMPVLEIRWGHRERAASTRARILSRRLRARLADSLISQLCLDHETPLITIDRDFRHFAEHTGQFGWRPSPEQPRGRVRRSIDLQAFSVAWAVGRFPSAGSTPRTDSVMRRRAAAQSGWEIPV